MFGTVFCFRSCLVQCFVFGRDWCIVLFFFNKSMSDEFEQRLYRYVSLNDGDTFRIMCR